MLVKLSMAVKGPQIRSSFRTPPSCAFVTESQFPAGGELTISESATSIVIALNRLVPGV